MEMNDPRTIVFYVQDQEKFQALWSQLIDSMANDQDFHGAIVTGAGKGDCMTELEELQDRS